jgi:glucokinase
MTALAGDIGDTDSRLAIYEHLPGGPDHVAREIYPSREYGCVAQIITDFLASPVTEMKRERRADMMCLKRLLEELQILLECPFRIDPTGAAGG